MQGQEGIPHPPHAPPGPQPRSAFPPFPAASRTAAATAETSAARAAAASGNAADAGAWVPCQDRTDASVSGRNFFSQIRLPGTVAEAASASRAVGKPALLPGAAACEPSVPRAGAARRSRTPAARRGTRSAPGTAFRHHLYFVFATTLQVNSRYPACQRLTCCDIPSYDKS